MKSTSRTGYVDAHVHVRDTGSLDVVAAAGVAAVRDAGTRSGSGLVIETSSGVAILSAGRALFRRGGYGASFGVPVGTRDEIRAEIRKLVDAGAGIIKVMASGMVSLTAAGAVTPGGFSAEDLSFLVAEARAQGINVMAHANGADAISGAVSAGVRSVEHGFFMTGELLKRMADRAVFWVPTAGALTRAAEAAGPSGHITDLLRSHLALICTAYELGVPLAVGTDCVLPDPRYGERYQRELDYFAEAGIPRNAVERIAREGGRDLLGLDQKIEGKKERG